MRSTPHRANILSARMRQVGIGVVSAGGRIWVTEVFRQPWRSGPALTGQRYGGTVQKPPRPTGRSAPFERCRAMAKDQYIQRLKTVPLFGLPVQEGAQPPARSGRQPALPATLPGRSRGHHGRGALAGRRRRARVHRGGRQVATLGPGDYFGELSSSTPSPRDATVIATTPVELLGHRAPSVLATVRAARPSCAS